MKIMIDRNRTFAGIQKEFGLMFPFLKIEFFKKTLFKGENAEQKKIKNNCSTLAEYSTFYNQGNIIITPQMTVTYLEQSFIKEFGVLVKIYRNSWRVWLEATVTDGWTLEEQNKQGEALSRSDIKNNC